MGCANSKTDKKALRLCKERKRFIKQAIDSRYALAASHVSYTKSKRIPGNSMMAKKSGSLDYWRNYFRTTNSDSFEIIDHAIMVAALDSLKEFKLRRDRIAERLFSCKFSLCLGCDGMELPVPCGGGEEDETEEEDDSDGGCKSSGFERGGCEFEPGWSKESKNSNTVDLCAISPLCSHRSP